MALETQAQAGKDEIQSPKYLLSGHITKAHELKSAEDVKTKDGISVSTSAKQARLATQSLLQEALEKQTPSPLGAAIQAVLPSEASITSFSHDKHKFHVKVGGEKKPSIVIDDTDAGSAMVLNIQGAWTYNNLKKQEAQGGLGPREFGNRMLAFGGGLLYGMGNEAQKQWTQDPVGAVLEGVSSAAIGYGLIAFEATAPHITSLTGAALLGTAIGHFLTPEQREHFKEFGNIGNQLKTANGMIALDSAKQVASNPLNKDLYHLAYGLIAGAAAIKPAVGMRAEMPSHELEQRAIKASIKFLSASPRFANLAWQVLQEFPALMQQVPAAMQIMFKDQHNKPLLATISGESSSMAKDPTPFKQSDIAHAMSQLPDSMGNKGEFGKNHSDSQVKSTKVADFSGTSIKLIKHSDETATLECEGGIKHEFGKSGSDICQRITEHDYVELHFSDGSIYKEYRDWRGRKVYDLAAADSTRVISSEGIKRTFLNNGDLLIEGSNRVNRQYIHSEDGSWEAKETTYSDMLTLKDNGEAIYVDKHGDTHQLAFKQYGDRTYRDDRMLYKPNSDGKTLLSSIRFVDVVNGTIKEYPPEPGALLNIKKSPHAEEIYKAIPIGSIPLGVGQSRVALLTPQKQAMVIGPVHDRPPCPLLVQAIKRTIFGSEESGLQAEYLPYADHDYLCQDDLQFFREKFDSSGWCNFEPKIENMGMLPDFQFVAVDPDRICESWYYPEFHKKHFEPQVAISAYEDAIRFYKQFGDDTKVLVQKFQDALDELARHTDF